MATHEQPIEITRANAADFVAAHDTYIFDCDGVLWTGTVAVPGAPEFVRYLKSLGKRVFFVSNNSTKSRATYVETFKKFGIPAVKEDVLSASYAAALYLQSINFTKKVYVVGQKGITEELTEAGISWIGGETDLVNEPAEALPNFVGDPEVAGVVCGNDYYINYTKIARAQYYLMRDPNSLFIASNTDTTFPSAGNILPGAGAIVNCVATCSHRTPLVVGKPNTRLLEMIISRHGLDPRRTVMVGDRLDTDMKFGIEGGVDTLLVLSGIGTLEDVRKEGNTVFPQRWATSVAVLLPDQHVDEVAKKEPAATTETQYFG